MFKHAFIGVVAALSLGSSFASTVYSNDFEGSVAEWTGPGVVVPTFFNKYLSNTDAGSAASTTTFSVGAGTAVTGASVSVLLGIVDSWDNGAIGYGPDAFLVKLDGGTVFSAVFDNYQNLGATTAPGLTNLMYGTNIMGSSYNDAVYTLNVNLGTLSAGSHTLSFVAVGPGWQGGGDESFALDNVAVTGTVVAVPEPETYGLALAGLLAVGIARRVRRQA